MNHFKLVDLCLIQIIVLKHILHVDHTIVFLLVHRLVFFSLNSWENKVLTNRGWIQTRFLINHLLIDFNFDTIVHRGLTR